MNSPWWLLVLFAAVACGYLLGRLDGRKRQSRKLDGLSQQYLQVEPLWLIIGQHKQHHGDEHHQCQQNP